MPSTTVQESPPPQKHERSYLGEAAQLPCMIFTAVAGWEHKPATFCPDFTQVAAPGKARNTTIQTLKELDQEVQHALPTGNDEIDLSLLITSLLPMEKVQEGEEAWDPEQLLHSVAFEMQAEKDLLAEEEEQVAADK